MRATSWTVRLAAPVAALTALTGVGFAAAALATPAAPGASPARAATSTQPPETTRSTGKTTRVKTTKPKTTKVKGPVCKPGCVLVTNDFETGSQGWTGPEDERLDVTTESAASGEQALEPVWINSSMGPSTTITSQRLLRPAGQTYLATVRFRQTGPNNGKPVSIAVKGATDVRTEAVAMSGQWQLLRAAFVPVATTITITVVEGPGNPCFSYPAVMQAVSIDDFTLEVPRAPVTFTAVPTATSTTCPTPTPKPSASWCPGCKVLTSTFESGDAFGWTAQGKTLLTVTKDAAANGTYGLSAQGVTYLDQPSFAIDASILDARNSVMYEASARVKMAPGQPVTTLRLYVAGAQKVWPTAVAVGPEGWTTVRTRFVVGTMQASIAQIRVSLGQEQVQSNCANPAAVNVLLDDVTLWVPGEEPPATVPFPKNCGTSVPATTAASSR